MNSVNKNMVLRYIVPFYLETRNNNDCYNDMLNALEQHELWQKVSSAVCERDVFSHMHEAVIENGTDSNLGSSWEYDFKNKRINIRCRMDKQGEDYTFWQICKVGLYVYRTNVGLIWFELVPSKKQGDAINISSVIKMQHWLKELNRTELHFEILQPKKSKDDPIIYNEFSAAEWISGILKNLSTEIHYLYGSCVKNGLECPDKALIFNYMMFNNTAMDEDVLRDLSFRLSNGYDEKYLVSQDSLAIAKMPFKNTCWYSSKGGCGYYAYSDDKNNAFFSSGITERIKNDYFFLYVLALYQSYSVLNFSRRIISEQSANAEKYYNPSFEGDKLDAFVAELNTFLMKGIHTSVSNVQHHNDFSNYVRERLLIKEEIESILTGTEALVKLQRIKKEKAEILKEAETEKQQIKNNRYLNFALGIISLFSVFTAFRDVDDIIEKLEHINFSKLLSEIAAGSFWTIVELIACTVVFVVAVVCIFVLFKNTFTKPERDEIDSE